MRFAKYHGLGNDFLVVDLRAASPDEAAAVQAPDRVIALCDRQFGVGGDGVLAVLPSATADARMRVLNSDGSEAEMCGNGIRCVAKELYDRGGLRKPELAIDTGAGRLTCAIEAHGGVTRSVTVAMGTPRLLRGEIPMTGPAGERCVEQALELDGVARAITCVSMGNPHAITFVGSRAEALERANTLGPRVEHHAWFPNRTNAEFAYVKDRREIDLVVWERGCGITLACGTGACATTVAAIVTGRADEGTPVRVNLPGGTLEITVHAGLTGVAMKGPALHVFDGELDLTQLAPRPR
jgi:diaminopimelate epimerase